MFRKILYPTDFSSISKKVVAAIKQLKDAGTEEIVLINVIDSRNIDAMVHWAPTEYEHIRNVIEDNTRKEAEEAARDLKEAGFKVTVMVTEGIPAQEILKAEKQTGVSSIIIGSHGKSNLQEMLLGSVSDVVIRKAEKPVIVIKR
ncbi:MAG: universal stress protein [Syntrophales bacterium]|jgi:nucleotide-binding universal stress UspA family protein|nr:universal stress protein [Syntrophales bacterium]MCK9527112.1 universal stress protein [Syntrophales bacterium]MDX9921763.1 universal stress protein [Syntrophales bacterium]